MEAPRVLNLDSSEYFSGPYGKDFVFIANDRHTALLPCYLKSMYQPARLYTSAKVAFCIHNIAYQGRFAFADFALLSLPDEFKSSFDFIDGYDKPVKGRKINRMKARILESDKVAFCIHNIAYQSRFAFADFALLSLPDEFKSLFDFIDGYDKPVKGRKINRMKARILESDKVCRCHGHPVDDKRGNKLVKSTSCPVTSNELAMLDLIRNSLKVTRLVKEGTMLQEANISIKKKWR
nr:granule-bound starch synthase [Tanacetum cinerariifolium]